MTKKHMFWAVKILITLAILVILIYTIEPDKIRLALKNARKEWVLLAAALLPLNIAVQFWKWRILLKTLKPDIGSMEVFSSLLVGFTLGLATPGRMGEIGRAFAIRDSEPIRIMGLSLTDKFYNLGCIALFGGLAILILPGMVLQQNVYIIISSAVIYLIGTYIVIYLLFHPGFVRGVLYSISLMLPKRDKLKALISCMDGISQRTARIVFLLSASFYLTFITQFFVMTRAFSNLSVWDGVRGLPAIVFTKTFLPVSIGGLGIGELASVQYLSLFKVEAAAAFNASMVLFSINVLLPGIIGFIFIPKLRFNLGGK